jgi:hypothetical protein
VFIEIFLPRRTWRYSNNTDTMERTIQRLNRGLRTYYNMFNISIIIIINMYIINRHSCAPLDKQYNLDISEIETRPLELY